MPADLLGVLRPALPQQRHRVLARGLQQHQRQHRGQRRSRPGRGERAERVGGPVRVVEHGSQRGPGHHEAGVGRVRLQRDSGLRVGQRGRRVRAGRVAVAGPGGEQRRPQAAPAVQRRAVVRHPRLDLAEPHRQPLPVAAERGREGEAEAQLRVGDPGAGQVAELQVRRHRAAQHELPRRRLQQLHRGRPLAGGEVEADRLLHVALGQVPAGGPGQHRGLLGRRGHSSSRRSASRKRWWQRYHSCRSSSGDHEEVGPVELGQHPADPVRSSAASHSGPDSRSSTEARTSRSRWSAGNRSSTSAEK